MRVLHVISSLSPSQGGTTTAMLTMARALQGAGVACEIAASDDDGQGRLAADAPERADPSRHYFARRRKFYSHAPDFAPWLKTNIQRYDLLHVHGLFSHMPAAAARIARASAKPCI